MNEHLQVSDPVSDPSAREMLEILGSISQEIDDLCDGDSYGSEAILSMMFRALCVLPENSFYQQHHARLMPLIRHAFMGYVASYRIECNHTNNGKSSRAIAFTIRDLLAMVVLECIAISDGDDVAMAKAATVWLSYTSTEDDWREWIDPPVNSTPVGARIPPRDAPRDKHGQIIHSGDFCSLILTTVSSDGIVGTIVEEGNIRRGEGKYFFYNRRFERLLTDDDFEQIEIIETENA